MPVATRISEDGARICLSERPRERVMRARPQEAQGAQGFFQQPAGSSQRAGTGTRPYEDRDVSGRLG